MAAKSTKILYSVIAVRTAGITRTVVEMKLIHWLIRKLPLLMIPVRIKNRLVDVRCKLRYTCVGSQSAALRHLHNRIFCTSNEDVCASRGAGLGAVGECNLRLIRTGIARGDHPVRVDVE